MFISHDNKAVLFDVCQLSKEEEYKDAIIICMDGMVRTSSILLTLISPVIKGLLIHHQSDENICISVPSIKRTHLEHLLKGLCCNQIRPLPLDVEVAALLHLDYSILRLEVPDDQASKSVIIPIIKQKNGKSRKRDDILKGKQYDEEEEDQFHYSDHGDQIDNDGDYGDESIDVNLEHSNSEYDLENQHPTKKKERKRRKEIHFCWICGLDFHLKSQLVDHIETHDQKCCPVCQKEPPEPNKLYWFYYGHIQNCKNKLSLKEQGLTKCAYCKMGFPINNIKEHRLKCGKRGNYICNICGKEGITNLKEHMKINHSIRPRLLSCDKCGKTFDTKQGLKTHILHVHTEKQPCPQCGVLVRRLQVHISQVHTADDQRRYQCVECGKGFDDNWNLQKHRMNIHLKLRPFQCRYGCADRYNDISNRNKHEKKKHGKLFTTAKEEKEKRVLNESGIS